MRRNPLFNMEMPGAVLMAVFQCFDDSGRNTGDNAVVGNVFGHDGTGGDDHIVSDRYAGQNGAVSTDPDVIAQCNRGVPCAIFARLPSGESG